MLSKKNLRCQSCIFIYAVSTKAENKCTMKTNLIWRRLYGIQPHLSLLRVFFREYTFPVPKNNIKFQNVVEFVIVYVKIFLFLVSWNNKLSIPSAVDIVTGHKIAWICVKLAKVQISCFNISFTFGQLRVESFFDEI